MPKFTIGIPTFNRASLLQTSLQSAVSQSCGDLEIIVSDNASPDNTGEVVHRFGSRVRYVRNETNLGANANFFRLVELASGEYFSWLQDDDCIFNHFVARAVECLDHSPQATVYGAYAAVAAHTNYLANGWLYGPPVRLDWTSMLPRSLPGSFVAPLSLCVSVAIPPVVAFRTAALSAAVSRCDQGIPLFMERGILADVAAQGEAIFDPCVAGVFRAHAQQGFRQMQADNPDAQTQQWLQMARQLEALPIRRDWRWRQQLLELVSESPEEHRRNWERESRTWPEDIPLCREMRAALMAKAPPKRVPLSPSGLAKAGLRTARSLMARVFQ
jgi:hypothetical protein